MEGAKPEHPCRQASLHHPAEQHPGFFLSDGFQAHRRPPKVVPRGLWMGSPRPPARSPSPGSIRPGSFHVVHTGRSRDILTKLEKEFQILLHVGKLDSAGKVEILIKGKGWYRKRAQRLLALLASKSEGQSKLHGK